MTQQQWEKVNMIGMFKVVDHVNLKVIFRLHMNEGKLLSQQGSKGKIGVLD